MMHVNSRASKNTPKNKGFFITLEGIEGTGKSTALHFIADYLRQKKQEIEMIITREPGGTSIAEKIRQIILTPQADEILLSETELLLMFAGRVQHIHQVILPALAAGKWVISDRFVDASFAYQGGGRGIDIAHIHYLEDWLLKDLRPDLTVLFDAPVEVGLSRAKQRAEQNKTAQDRIEQEKVNFFERVRKIYLQRLGENPDRFRKVDATQPLNLVENALKKIVDEQLDKQLDK